jgi:hypothetical protein
MISDPIFRAARKAGARGIGRVLVPLVLLVILALVAGQFSALGDSGLGLSVGVVAAALVVLILFRETRRLLRNRAAWSRAARGAVSLTLRGEAVAKQRTVAGRPMRTLVVQHGGKPHYLHLLFAKGAPADTMRQGPVTVEFFATDDAEGPARLLLADGRTLWAFTSRLGDRLPADERRGARRGARRRSSRSTEAGSGAIAPAVVGNGTQDLDRDRDGAGPDDVPGDSVWSGSDGWTGGSSWGGDSTWSGSDGGSGGGDGGWSGGGWSGGDSGGGGGDSGGGSF